MTTPEGDAAVEVLDEVTPDAPEEELDPATALKNDLRATPGQWYVIHSYAG